MSDRQTPKFKRILLKLSGEALAGDEKFGISAKALDWIANEIVEVHNLKVEIAIVVGGGNIFRGVPATYQGMDRATADYIGMLATTINSLALQNTLETRGLFTRVLSAIEMQQLAETYIRRRATRHLEKGRIVILAAGTGNPYFTTDTASALRAMEIGAEVILKATKVDGVFDSDPIENPKAKMFRELTYLDVLQKKLKVMDSTAISLCMDHDLPILVFNLLKKGNIKKAVLGHGVGTLVKKGN